MWHRRAGNAGSPDTSDDTSRARALERAAFVSSVTGRRAVAQILVDRSATRAAQCVGIVEQHRAQKIPRARFALLDGLPQAAEDPPLGLMELAPDQREHRAHEHVVRPKRALRGDDRRAVVPGQAEAGAPVGDHPSEAGGVLLDRPDDPRAFVALDAAFLRLARLL